MPVSSRTLRSSRRQATETSKTPKPERKTANRSKSSNGASKTTGSRTARYSSPRLITDEMIAWAEAPTPEFFELEDELRRRNKERARVLGAIDPVLLVPDGEPKLVIEPAEQVQDASVKQVIDKITHEKAKVPPILAEKDDAEIPNETIETKPAEREPLVVSQEPELTPTAAIEENKSIEKTENPGEDEAIVEETAIVKVTEGPATSDQKRQQQELAGHSQQNSQPEEPATIEQETDLLEQLPLAHDQVLDTSEITASSGNQPAPATEQPSEVASLHSVFLKGPPITYVAPKAISPAEHARLLENLSRIVEEAKRRA